MWFSRVLLVRGRSSLSASEKPISERSSIRTCKIWNFVWFLISIYFTDRVLKINCSFIFKNWNDWISTGKWFSSTSLTSRLEIQYRSFKLESWCLFTKIFVLVETGDNTNNIKRISLISEDGNSSVYTTTASTIDLVQPAPSDSKELQLKRKVIENSLVWFH